MFSVFILRLLGIETPCGLPTEMHLFLAFEEMVRLKMINLK